MKRWIGFIVHFLSACIVAAAQNTDNTINKGNVYYREAQFDLAEKQYKAVLKKDAKNSTAQYNLSLALYKQKKYREAQNVLDELAKGSPDGAVKAAAYYNKGVIYTKEKSLEESIESYKADLRLNPNDKEGRENLQKALLELKKQQQEQRQQKQPRPQSRLTQKEAAQKLKQLQNKEQELQDRLQNKGQKGTSMPKDW